LIILGFTGHASGPAAPPVMRWTNGRWLVVGGHGFVDAGVAAMVIGVGEMENGLAVSASAAVQRNHAAETIASAHLFRLRCAVGMRLYGAINR
jgi:hypothetical protein